MKKKWIVLAGVVLALGALVAVAAAHRGGKMRGRGPRDLIQQLDLSSEQREQLKELRSEHRGQMKEMWRDGPEPFKALREEHHAAVSKILTEAQRGKLEALRGKVAEGFFGGEMRGHRGRRGDGMRGGRGHGAKNAFAKLDLSSEQQEQLKGLHQAHREEVGKLKQEHYEAMEKLLTEAQREKLETLKDEAFYGGKRRQRRPMW